MKNEYSDDWNETSEHRAKRLPPSSETLIDRLSKLAEYADAHGESYIASELDGIGKRLVIAMGDAAIRKDTGIAEQVKKLPESLLSDSVSKENGENLTKAASTDHTLNDLREAASALIEAYRFAHADKRPLHAIQPNIDIVRELLANTPKREVVKLDGKQEFEIVSQLIPILEKHINRGDRRDMAIIGIEVVRKVINSIEDGNAHG
jgi:hypothetical protein